VAPIFHREFTPHPTPTPWQAIVGFYGAAGAAATSCPANSYCESGTERPMACPSGTQSTELANDLTDCVSSPGYYGPNGKPGTHTYKLRYHDHNSKPRNLKTPRGRLGPLTGFAFLRPSRCGRSDRGVRPQVRPANFVRPAVTAPSPPPSRLYVPVSLPKSMAAYMTALLASVYSPPCCVHAPTS
jgi:hypothetical protein